MRDVYEADTLYEAELLIDLLAKENIRAIVRNAHLLGALGELPLTVRPIVSVVHDGRWADALMVADDFDVAKHRPPQPARQCGACGEESPGNFEVCWRCRRPLDDRTP